MLLCVEELQSFIETYRGEQCCVYNVIRAVDTLTSNTLLKSDVTRRDHVVRCRGSQECWFTLCQFHCQFHSRRHSLRITLKSTTLVCMRSSNAWTTKPWQRSEWRLGFNSVFWHYSLPLNHSDFQIWHFMSYQIHLKVDISSVESQKGVIEIQRFILFLFIYFHSWVGGPFSSADFQRGQRCSVENQKGAIRCTMSMTIAPFWFSAEHFWIAITPFWLSTDDINAENNKCKFKSNAIHIKNVLAITLNMIYIHWLLFTSWFKEWAQGYFKTVWWPKVLARRTMHAWIDIYSLERRMKEKVRTIFRVYLNKWSKISPTEQWKFHQNQKQK